MLCIIDQRSSNHAKLSLQPFVDRVIEFQTDNIVYDAISGHPDIFLCDYDPHTLIVAPNIPRQYLDILISEGISIISGKYPVGNRYPFTARYNALFTNDFLICNSKTIDPTVLDNKGTRQLINVPQGYVRCNTINLTDNVFITSDQSICKQLIAHSATVLYVSPKSISIHGFPHGFIGGTMGICDNKLFINGSLSHFPDGDLIVDFASHYDIDIITLHPQPLYDGGGIIFKKK